MTAGASRLNRRYLESASEREIKREIKRKDTKTGKEGEEEDK
jgi:hypothetical protein